MGINYKDPGFYMGPVTASYAAYANDEGIRDGAASGGVVSSLLIYLLQNGYVDGAFVSRQYMNDGRIEVDSFVATTPEEILDARTSIYTYFPIEKNYAKMKEFKGRIAAVLLPCGVNSLEVYISKNPELKDRVPYVISLFCGGVAEEALMQRILKKSRIDPKSIERIYSRKGHWRGATVIKMKDGTERQISYTKNWSTYKNAFFFSHGKCFSCTDHFGYKADFSCGDIWLQEMKKVDIKHTAIVAKNDKANQIIKEMQAKNLITAKEVTPEFVLRGNKRAIIYKFHTAEARKKLGPRYGIRYIGDPPAKSNWNHYIAAWFILHNMKASKSEKSIDRLFKIPKRLIYLYMVFIRVLINK